MAKKKVVTKKKNKNETVGYIFKCDIEDLLYWDSWGRLCMSEDIYKTKTGFKEDNGIVCSCGNRCPIVKVKVVLPKIVKK